MVRLSRVLGAGSIALVASTLEQYQFRFRCGECGVHCISVDGTGSDAYVAVVMSVAGDQCRSIPSFGFSISSGQFGSLKGHGSKQSYIIHPVLLLNIIK